MEGIVIAIGSGRIGNNGETIPVAVKEGDRVLLPEYGGNTVKIENEEYQIYRDEQLLAIIRD